MSDKTETARHIIYRTATWDPIIDDLMGIPPSPKTQIYDKRTGNWGEGVGNTREEADRRAWDDLESKNRSS